MEDKKPRGLDILRLIIAILTLTGAILAIVSMALAVYQLFTYDGEDSISGLVLVFIIPFMIGAIVYAIISVKWIKKYNKVKNVPLLKRTNTISMCLTKIILILFFLEFFGIPFAVYWFLDLIEAIKHNNLSNKLKAQNPEPEYKTNETHPVDEPNKCKQCGALVDYRYARFCEHCGAEIEYRK